MRKWAWILLAVAGLSCNREGDTILFEIPFPNLDFTIPAGLNPLDTWYFNIDNVPTNALALFSANGIDTAAVRSLVPNTARMLALFNNVDYEFVYEIAVHLCEQGDQTPRCGKEIFYRFPLPNKPGPFVDLVPNPVEVGSLILKDKVNVQVVLRFISPPPQFVETRLDLDFVVK